MVVSIPEHLEVLCVAVLAILVSSLARAEDGQYRPSLTSAIHHDISPALRDLIPTSAEASRANGSIGQVGTTNFLNIAGMASAGTYLDADPNGAVGATQYVQWTNARYAVFDKVTGKVVLPPTTAKNLWLGFGGSCETTNAGDGIVLYDQLAGRWVITHHTGNPAPYLQCFAISTTSDATGTYYRYSFQLTQQYPDWPKVGLWPDAYYVAANLLDPVSFSSLDAQVCALDRVSMLAGAAATAQCFQTGTPTLDYVLMPASLDGMTPPKAGVPNYLLSLNANSLDLFKFHVDWVNPIHSFLKGPHNIVVQSFSPACLGGVCVPQLGTTQLLDSVGDRLMYRLAYRNFGDHEALVVNHSVNDPTAAFAGVRWYEIRSPGGNPVVYQTGTWMPDSSSRWMGSIAMDKLGDIMLGYTISSTAMYPSSAFTGRLATDPAGTMQAENYVGIGLGFKTDYHWGDYSSMSIDPVDDCTFWFTTEYMRASGSAWATRIASMKFPSCQ